MKFKLTIIQQDKSNLLPINYQYELSSWIYKTLSSGNAEFANWLHNKGYTDGNKRFKLFTFSKLYAEKYSIKADRIELLTEKAILYISFYLEQAAEPFIIGLFKNQEFSIGDKISSITFRISAIEKLPEPQWTNEMFFRTSSPIIIGIKDDRISKNAQYISPEDTRYSEYFTQNLVSKFLALLKNRPDISQNITFYQNTPLDFQLTGQVKSKLIKIKIGTTSETMVKGYLFDFKLSAPPELMRMGYYAGFGEKNSLGFGSVDIRN